MELIQLLTLGVVVMIAVVAITKFLMRDRSKNCAECKRIRQQRQVEEHRLQSQNVERDTDSESDISDSEENDHDDTGVTQSKTV